MRFSMGERDPRKREDVPRKQHPSLSPLSDIGDNEEEKVYT